MKLDGKPLELVILDVDGVIIELHPGVMKTFRTVAASFGLPGQPAEDYFNGLLNGAHQGKSNLIDTVKMIWPCVDNAIISRFVEDFNQYERDHPYPALPGSIDTIRWLMDNCVKVALCTNNTRQHLLPRLTHVGIDPAWFTAVSTCDGGYWKPDARMLDTIFQKVPVPKEHSVFIGDWFPDVAVARNAGVPFLAVLSGHTPRRALAQAGVPEDRFIAGLSELRNLVRE